MARGRSLIQEGRHAEGLQALDDAIQLIPQDPTAFKLRAMLRHHVLREHAAAVADLDEVLRLNPGDIQALELRGTARGWMEGQEDLAIVDFDHLIRQHPLASAFKARSALFSRKKETKKAIADLDEALRLEPNDVHALKIRGILWAGVNESEHFEKAIADYEQVRRLKPDDTDAHLFYLWAAWEYATSPIESRRDAEKALEYANRVRQILLGDPTESDEFRVLAAAHAEAGDFNRALAAVVR